MCRDGEFHWLISLLFFPRTNYFLSENPFEMNKGVFTVEVVNVAFYVKKSLGLWFVDDSRTSTRCPPEEVRLHMYLRPFKVRSCPDTYIHPKILPNQWKNQSFKRGNHRFEGYLIFF